MVEKILLKEMEKCVKRKEVPISALIIHNGKVISKAHNNKNIKNNVMGHAEIIAIIKASKKLKTWNLSSCSLFVTVKPCSMCVEIIKESRIKEVFYYLDNEKVINNKIKLKKLSSSSTNEMKDILKKFFKSIRNE